MKSSLNHIFRTIWSEALNTWVAVSEITPAKGKSRSCVLSAAELAENDSESGNIAKPSRKLRLKPLALVLACSFSFHAQANPVGAQVVSGIANINQSGNLLTVTNTPNAIINWQGFSIGSSETTRFIQQSAASSILNRVVGSNPSSLLGTLTSNGKVFLINPAGILVGQGANINVPGFVASTLNLSNTDFLAGNLNFTANPNAGTVQNNGNITTPEGGTVYLVAPQVENYGVINTPKGETILAAGNTVQLVDTGTPGVSVQITGSSSTATNLGQILADSGRIGMVGAMVSNSGTISANSLVSQGGKIFLMATNSVNAGGTIAANGTSGGSVDISAAHSLDPGAPGLVIQTGVIQAQGTTGTGGSVSLSADNILSAAAISADGTAAGGLINVQAGNLALTTSSAQYTADSAQGAGGNILVVANVSNYSSGSYSATGATGGNLTFAGSEIKLAGAQFNASGNNEGGNILVGGLMHGAAGFSAQGIALANATDVLTNSSTSFTADGGIPSPSGGGSGRGNGGQVVLWSDQAMSFTGNISAKGGVLGGNGGMAEVSGLTSFAFGGGVNLSATNGLNGTLLLDPNSITIIPGTSAVAAAGSGTFSATEFIDPNPGAGYGFGGAMKELGNGNLLIISPTDGFGGTNAGAVFLYSPTGTLISTLTGNHANDQVGYGGVNSVTDLNNGNYLLKSIYWNNGGTNSNGMGAVTWFSETAGVSGIVSSSNSLVGSTAGDQVGYGGVTLLSTGNYVVDSYNWNNGTATTAGAVTWGSGSAGVSGVVSSSNSLVGSTTGDQVGYYGVTSLSSGNYVVRSPNWGSNGTASAGLGAVTWGSGTAGVSGTVSSTNSLVGSTAGDQVGISFTPLSNGNYVVDSYYWNNGGTVANALGAVTWGSGTAGVTGTVSAANSLVGTTPGDQVGIDGVTALGNGNYVVDSYNWNNGGTVASAGAVTWGSGTAGVFGPVSAANSLVGSSASDQVGSYFGSNGVQELTTSGNYVVKSIYWNSSMGAVTWGSGTAGVTGAVSAANSLVGSTTGDQVGREVIQLTGNGNYVVVSPYWNNSGSAANAGAVTWGSGTLGVTGAVSAANSLVGSTAGDSVGNNLVTTLSNGNYIVLSPYWNNGGTLTNALGAVTWVNGSNGHLFDNNLGEPVSAANSLVGSTPGDMVGISNISYSNPLNNGNYIVLSPDWGSNGTAGAGLGAVTWGNGTAGVIGTVSSTNSLVGSTTGDQVGIGGVFAVGNGNYVVNSYYWSNGGTLANALGAVTWGSGTAGVSGVVSFSNSLVGSTPGDQVGSGGVQELYYSGNYVVQSPLWNGSMGAVTWGSGTAGVIGPVSATNSLVGSTAGDQVGSGYVTQLANGNYVVIDTNWNGSRGAVTWGSGTAGVTGTVSAANSLVGSATGDRVGYDGVTELYYTSNDNYLVLSSTWGSNGTASAGLGAVTWGSGTAGITGVVSSSNSLVGSTAGDQVGYGSVVQLTNGNYVVIDTHWNGSMGSVTWGSGASGISGVVSSTNSLVGSNANDQVGIGGVTQLDNGNYVVDSYYWNNGGTNANGLGAVTWGSGTAGVTGTVSAANSLVGSTPGDSVGANLNCGDGCNVVSGITPLYNGNYVVSSYYWNNGAATAAGAVSWGSGTGGLVGAVSAANSLTGSTINEHLGSYVVELLYGTNLGSVYVGASTAANGPLAGAGLAFILSANASATVTGTSFTDNPTTDVTIGAGYIAGILNNNTNVDLQANSDITQLAGAGITSTGTGELILEAVLNVTLNDVINTQSNVSISSSTGSIVEAGAGAISTPGTLTASAATGITLTGANMVGTFYASNATSGNIALTNTASPLTITGISNTGGDILVDNTGATITTGLVTSSGAVTIVAHSPLTIGSDGVSATGNITLTAGSTGSASDKLTLNGLVKSTAGDDILSAGDAIIQNVLAMAPNGVVILNPDLNALASPVQQFITTVLPQPPCSLLCNSIFTFITTNLLNGDSDIMNLLYSGDTIGGTVGTFGESDSSGTSGGGTSGSGTGTSSGGGNHNSKGKPNAKPNKC